MAATLYGYMVDREYTLLELHFHSHGDISLSPGIETGGQESSFAKLMGSETKSASGQPDTESDEGSRRLPVVAFAVVVVAAVAAAALKRRQSAPEPTEGKRRIPPT